jgi:hypothetical protein
MGMIPSPQRYLVIYKPSEDEPVEYIGPFVSKTLAENYATFDLKAKKAIVRPLLNREQALETEH